MPSISLPSAASGRIAPAFEQPHRNPPINPVVIGNQAAERELGGQIGAGRFGGDWYRRTAAEDMRQDRRAFWGRPGLFIWTAN